MANNDLFKVMLYSEYRQVGIFGHQEFWTSKRQGTRYSGNYDILNNLNASDLYSKAKRKQYAYITNTLEKKYSIQLNKFNQFIAQRTEIENQETELKDIEQQIARFFNTPFKTQQGFFYKTGTNKGTTLNTGKQIKNKMSNIQANFDTLNKTLQTLLQNPNFDLIKQFNHLIDASFKNENPLQFYSSEKGRIIESLIAEILEKLRSKSNNNSYYVFQTGSITQKGESLGEDIMILENLTINDLAKLGTITAQATVDQTLYKFLKSKEAFSIQVKSGDAQHIYNAKNAIYHVQLSKLRSIIKELQLLKTLNEWNYGDESVNNKGQTKINHSQKTGSSRVEGSTGYFRDYIEDKIPGALATLQLSTDIQKLESLFRMNEYQVLWIPSTGYISIPQYFKNTNQIWAVANTFFGNKEAFYYRDDFWTQSRNIALKYVK